jgi:transcriptional regulator with XRE-family HTH domain
MENFSENLSKQLKFIREQRGLLQAELAQILSVSPQTISNWETGDRTPRLADILRLADFFGVSLDFLFKRPEAPSELPQWLIPLLEDLASLDFAGQNSVRALVFGLKK